MSKRYGKPHEKTGTGQKDTEDKSGKSKRSDIEREREKARRERNQ